MLLRWAARVIVAMLLCVVSSSAQAAEPGESLTISVLTIGPGDQAFSKFGHIAILIEDAEKDPDLVYNYGTFSFDSPTLVADFLKGRLRYWLSVETREHMVKGYARARRTVTQQELELSPAPTDTRFSDLECAFGKPRIPLRLLSRQLLDARARRARSHAGWRAVASVARARVLHLSRSYAPAHGRGSASLPRSRRPDGAAGRCAHPPLGRGVSPGQARSDLA